ncbi:MULTISPECIES: cob(I)yrinic acid a,c-diamide adenosyltransferase [unclassified Arsukibacterium]|uniref:cob(I)yrinic acid a,c-diamide adenosyltransferase n=1 Tax=unclassified Arsukibacterium TaxID=2635278 RepID=UPI0025C61E06|nr:MULTISPECIES: cob(I)yrinic acid a,c-diamide adenosyltransferase [unclassified Arsukibacterium]|tara:strand:- start:35635 stop:36288 length:654 start_codon:yes stop_codon:yes gene_type:complete
MSDDKKLIEQERTTAKVADEQNRQQRHKLRQQKLQQQVQQGIAKATAEKGLLLVITGNGKGKSTSGFGTVARAVGHGLTAAVVQFIKGSWECGERNLLAQHQVEFAVMATGFTWDTQDKAADIAAAEQVWARAEQMLADPAIDVVLLDELTYMVSYHYIELERIVRALQNRPATQHVVITGRSCHRTLIEMADTVSEVQVIKHAFDAGIKAQRGIDW